jgi:hypothetical protein
MPPSPALNLNPLVNPFAAMQRIANVAVLGQSLQNQALLNNQVPLNPSSGLGYGSLLTSSAYGGYGSSSYGSGGYGSGSDGSYGQSMENPYEGYLRGAVSLTTANAQYQLTIQQAKLVRHNAVRAAIQTRRTWIEEAEFERAHLPDPEKIRQAELARALDRARVSPPLTEIWSARSLNTLLGHLIAQQGRAVRGPNVPLSVDTLKLINLTVGDTRGNIGLLKDNGNLHWPQLLQGGPFKEAHDDLRRHLRLAARTVATGKGTPAENTLSDLDAALKKLNETLDSRVSRLSVDQYVEAKRYLQLLGNTLTALKDRNVSNYFNGTWSAKGKSVAELVKYMADKGLRFAPATPNDEPAYLALYHALASFDAGISRGTPSPSDGSDNSTVRSQE